jgi:hypothetical protein
LNRHAEAEHLLLAAYNNLAADRGTPLGVLRDVLDRIIVLYESWGKPEQAAGWRLKRMDVDFPPAPFGH